MVHHYCHEKGIKDTSRKETYHNSRFRDIARMAGLRCNRTDIHGWAQTSLDAKADRAIRALKINKGIFSIYRKAGGHVGSQQQTHMLKWICDCGFGVRVAGPSSRCRLEWGTLGL